MELTDTHCHIHSVGASPDGNHLAARWAAGGDTDPAAVIRRAHNAGVTRLVCVGTDLADSQLAINFVADRPNCWAAIGIHPHEAKHYTNDNVTPARFATLATAPDVVAVGECGLDYFYEHSDKASQLAVLKFQIELASQHNLPLIFHVREAFDDFWPVFERYHSRQPIRGVLHSFTDSAANLARGLEYGLYIGINGIATFTKNPAQQELYRTVPLQNLLLETDAPFLTPVPYRGKICEPYHIRTTLEFLANLRGEAMEIIADVTTQNARRLFGI